MLWCMKTEDSLHLKKQPQMERMHFAAELPQNLFTVNIKKINKNVTTQHTEMNSQWIVSFMGGYID